MVNRHKINLAMNHAFSLLPQKMDSYAARLQIYATCLQESNFTSRRQKGEGPAVSFAQFERIAIQDVIERPRTRMIAIGVLNAFGLEPDVEKIWRALQLERYDALAFCFARLNYSNSNIPMPESGYEREAWDFYLKTWRPGKPHPQNWPRNYWRAYGAILG